jgi:hypothetical protein
MGTCRDLQGDLANCGACGTTCARGPVCAAGVCAASCRAGQVVYEHALPELYKTAHELDRFLLTDWVSSEESAALEHVFGNFSGSML